MPCRVYNINRWVDQIIDFIENVILPEQQDEGTSTRSTKVHLVGNSVGGHIAAHIAMRRPDLISSICLLNPTPVWGSKLPGWNGHLPAPAIPKAVGRYLFDRIRDLKTIEQFLEATYSRKEALTQELMHQIRGATLGNGGHAAFASIMWSPPLNALEHDNKNNGKKGDFQDCLVRVPCDVLLVFGKDDPWCKPAFAKNMLKALEERQQDNNSATSTTSDANDVPVPIPPVHRYVEITNAGHCPNHEAPKAVGHLVKAWVDAKHGNRSKQQLALINNIIEQQEHETTGTTTSMRHQRQRQHKFFTEEWGENAVVELDRENIELGFIDRFVTSFMS